jgi:hypothetical protein
LVYKEKKLQSFGFSLINKKIRYDSLLLFNCKGCVCDYSHYRIGDTDHPMSDAVRPKKVHENHRKDKPWDTDDIDHWKVVPWTEDDSAKVSCVK